MLLLIGFVLSFIIALLGCFVGFAYNILEWISKKKYKWMYPVANILWFTGLIPFIIIFIILIFKNFVT